MQPYLLSIVLFGEGLLTGITLTAMLGPVTMMILKYGIQVNRAAGVWAAIGTWISDFVFIAVTYWLTASISSWTEEPGNKFWIFMISGVGLLGIGFMMASVRRKAKELSINVSTRSYAQAFAAGFIVNSLSPFTLFFWIGAAVFLHLQEGNAFWYYLGLMITLGIGDFLKAWLAPKINKLLHERYVYWIQVVAGVVIAVTGIYLVIFGLTSDASSF